MYIAEKYDDYLRDKSLEIPSVTHRVKAVFRPKLRNFNLKKYIYNDEAHASDFVIYSSDVTKDEEVNYLRELVTSEIKRIFRFYTNLTHSECFSFGFPRVLLSSDKIFIERGTLSDKEIVDRINDLLKDKGDIPYRDHIKELILQRKKTYNASGMYYPYEEYIEISYRCLNASSEKVYAADLRRTLAHEVFHYIHYHENVTLKRHNYFGAECLIESLADFFSMLYILNIEEGYTPIEYKECENLAYRLYKGWKKDDDRIWPYSYALNYMCNRDFSLRFTCNIEKYYKYKAIDTFNKVLEMSKRSIPIAIDELDKGLLPQEEPIYVVELDRYLRRTSYEDINHFNVPRDEHVMGFITTKQEGELDDIIKEVDMSFYRELENIAKRNDVKVSELIEQANISKSYYYQCKKGEKEPSKKTVISLIFSSHASSTEFMDLLDLSGYSLGGNKLDRVVRYFVDNDHMDIYDIEMYLDSRGISTIRNYE